jgi:hypothetical protein
MHKLYSISLIVRFPIWKRRSFRFIPFPAGQGSIVFTGEIALDAMQLSVLA